MPVSNYFIYLQEFNPNQNQMKKLEFKDSDVRLMRKFYLEELEKTLEKLDHIKKVLAKIGGEGDSVEISIQRFGKRKSAPDSTSGVASQKDDLQRKPGRPKKTYGNKRKPGIRSAWARLILSQLSTSDRPLTYNELTDEVMKTAKIPASKKESTKRSVVNVAFRLKNRDKKIKTFSVGQKEKYIARIEWFNDSGRISREYLQKINS
jgi:hypothetical protein